MTATESVEQLNLDGSLMEKVLSASERVGELYVNLVRNFHKMTPQKLKEFEKLRCEVIMELATSGSELEKLAVEYHRMQVRHSKILAN